jgi:hypothetical protein
MTHSHKAYNGCLEPTSPMSLWLCILWPTCPYPYPQRTPYTKETGFWASAHEWGHTVFVFSFKCANEFADLSANLTGELARTVCENATSSSNLSLLLISVEYTWILCGEGAWTSRPWRKFDPPTALGVEILLCEIRLFPFHFQTKIQTLFSRTIARSRLRDPQKCQFNTCWLF